MGAGFSSFAFITFGLMYKFDVDCLCMLVVLKLERELPLLLT